MSGTTGPSSSQTPYLVGLQPNVSFVSIISTGDQVGVKPDGVSPWVFGGIPDGIGAFDNGDGTMTVLVNHEIFPPNAAVVREHGAPGAYVSQLIVDTTTLEVVDAFDAANRTYTDADGDGVWVEGPTTINRLCSADLPEISAFFYEGADGIVGTADDVGTQDRIFMNGEEFGPEGRAFAWVITGDEARTAWELPALGNFSWENSVASPDSGAKTIVLGTDDATPGQVYVYVGDKQAAGNTVEKAGLTNGILYGIKASGIGNGASSENIVGTVPTSGTFELVALPDARTQTGAQLDAASDALGVSEFARPEDVAWDTIDPNRMYFVTTGSGAAPARLWAFTFADLATPELGGTFELLLDGTEGAVSLDNITVDAAGRVWMNEDPGNSTRNAKTWVYDPATDTLEVVAGHDVARFGDGAIPATAPFTINEEASGILDVTHILGDADTQAFLVDVQAHFPFPPGLSDEVVEGGQLLVMYVEAATDGTEDADTILGGWEGETLSAFGGDDLMLGGSGNDSLSGGAGADTVDGMDDNDTLLGDAGDDSLLGGAGDDSLSGGDGLDTLDGQAGNDTLSGGADADSLVGGEGNDSLDGGTAGDAMAGGLGDDTYVVDSVLDTVTEAAGAGIDTIRSGISLTLAAEVENLVLTGTGSNTGTGNGLANALEGNSGANVLDGRAGADTMTGLTGNDTYLVDDAGDLVVEAAGGGTDLVISTVSAMLSANVENLQLAGNALIGGMGNELGNRINGNDRRNQIDGKAGGDTIFGEGGNDNLLGGDGNDQIFGGDENDRIIGGRDADTLTGDTGNDTFVFANLNFGQDRVTDYEAGFDRIELRSTGFASTAQVLDYTIDTVDGARILVSPASSILLLGVLKADLSASDFILV